MALPKMPMVQVLDRLMLTLLAADLQTKLEAPDLTIRWMRNRYTTAEERPCIAVAFVSDAPPDRDDQYAAAGEMIRELAVDIIADVELPTEVAEEALGNDTAGLQILSAYLTYAVQALKAGFIDQANDATPLSEVTHWVEDLGIADDEDLADENGRLVCRLNVMYRVRSEDPTVLLAITEQ